MKKITGKLSLQWRLTLITALLMTVTCILMYFFISQSAVAGMENLGDYMIRIDNTDSAPITFNMDPSVLFPELSDQLQLTKKLFLTKGLMVTGIIILLSSICTYFISRQALLPLRRLSQEVNQIEVQNLSEALEVPATSHAWMRPLLHRSSFLPMQPMSLGLLLPLSRQIWRSLPAGKHLL